ncbi:MAG: flagellar type III secretion system pore protein FliP [Candidatus Gastranaerophilales bacterium]|nr:flagellar type III secretion system pore protein FliP [Candidatus Gastranaerophilales bacterium]
MAYDIIEYLCLLTYVVIEEEIIPMNFIKKYAKILCTLLVSFLTPLAASAAVTFPTVTVGMTNANTPQEFTQGVQILVLMTVLTLAPSILIMTTAFIRIIIVLALTRQAIGTASLPPNQVLAGLAIILTFFVMAPTINQINTNAVQPYLNNQITQQVAIEKAVMPLREFMIKHTEEKEIALFCNMAKLERPKNWNDVPTYIILPSFVLSELKVAFTIGFVIFLPFLVIDMIVSSILVSMGMLFLPPTVVATPFKLILFVMIDGWYLITKSLLESFVV